MNVVVSRYLKISLINFLLVSILGVVLRYKILYSLPFVDQKYLLHAHSHFAFAGWITQTLMVLMVAYLSKQSGKNEFQSYHKILIANLITAYGMLLSFPFQGYGPVSITFSTLSVFTFYVFAFQFWKSLNKLPVSTLIHSWFKVSLLIGVLSSFGTFGLAYMMANKIYNQDWFLSAIYFYLHFQYNGWFFFAGMGLLFTLFPSSLLASRKTKIVFILFAISVVPAYILSILWLHIPLVIYAIVVIASILELIACFMLMRILIENRTFIFFKSNSIGTYLLCLSAFALCLKLLLQVGSTIPMLQQYIFGFRTVIIAYLHLVLLGVFSFFLIGFMIYEQLLNVNKLTKYGVIVFVIGVILNEVVLMLQGLASIRYTVFPFANQLLFGIAIILFLGIFMIRFSQKPIRQQKNN